VAVTRTTNTSSVSDFLRDIRVIQIVGQVIFSIAVIILIYGLATSILSSLQAANLTPNFTFLTTTGGFDISETPAWYTSRSTYLEAFQVGVLNTLRVAAVGLVLATFVGVFVGIFLLSNNWLIRNISRVYVEILRNTPLLVQLFAWYFIVMYSLPQFQQSIAIPQESMTLVPLRLLAYLVLAVVVWRYTRRYTQNSPRYAAAVSGALAAVTVVEAGFLLARTQPGWRDAFGSANIASGNFLVYLGVSLLLIVGAFFLRSFRAPALGSAVGQLAGGLLFYFGLIPGGALRFELYPAVFINIRGFAFPELIPSPRFPQWMAFVAVGIALGIFLWLFLGFRNETTDGKKYPRLGYALLAVVAFTVIGWLIVANQPGPATLPFRQGDQIVYLSPEAARAEGLIAPREQALYTSSPVMVLLPQKTNFRVIVGNEISPEYMALLLGLAVYTSAFIAEIVRAGIQAVPSGQVEAARALGFSTGQVLRLVILPQALRVIIPPLGNQYLNLTKNSSLAVAVAYADIYLVSITMAGTSGQSVPIIVMVMGTYLIMSLSIATVMNWVNRRFQLVTR
jgi:His/Glu/Gln/Arg/opine family amino acid ABC transporter permease subunit